MATTSAFPTFPGPHTFCSSRKKFLRLTVFSALFTAFGIFLIVKAVTIGIFVAAVSGLGTMIGAVTLLPGASTLRLDESGFEVTKLLIMRKRYRWRDVSDFVAFDRRLVVFKAERPRQGLYERLNAAMAGGRNGYLPDTYGMTTDDLAELMISWRYFALNSPNKT